MKKVENMKQNIIIFIFMLAKLCISLGTQELVPVAGLGKTHFISGYDHTKTRQKRNKDKKQKINKKIKVFFSPNGDVCGQLCNLIAQEQRHIRVAIYTLTDKKVMQVLCDAHKRGVRVEVVTEKTTLLDRYSKIDDLADAGISIYAYPINKKEEKMIRGIMHNKFVVFSQNKNNKKIVWLGSFNFTKAGREHNRESVVVVYDNDIFAQFAQEFNTIKQLSQPYKIRT